MINYPKKKDLESILVFGASAHIGKPLARYVTENAPGVRLRLATSSAEKSIALKREFPNAEVVVADYYDLPSMRAATEEMEGIFLVSPDFLDENIAMSIFRRAVTENNALVHAIRILADPPGVTLSASPRKCMHLVEERPFRT
ncbi:MAG: NmrA family NAD(P)-binding protein [Porticoccaceae bacterium]